MRVVSLLLLIVLSSSMVLAAQPNVFINFVDINSKEAVSDVFLEVELNGKTTQYFIEQGDKLNLILEDGQHTIKVLVDKSHSSGYDYIGSSTFFVEGNTIKTLHVRPVGSLHGFVKDKLDNVIANADLKFECSRGVAVQFPSKADHFGSFSLDAVPVGNCLVTATYDGAVGSQSVSIVQGEQSQVDIKLDQILVSSQGITVEKSNMWIIGIVLLVLILIGLYFVFVHRKKVKPVPVNESKPKNEKQEEPTKENSKLGQRGQDLLRTLRDNERKIVTFLLEQQEAVYLSKIHHKTGMSKGSIFRNLRSLEHKSIVETFNEGRIRKVRLTQWFLE